MKVLTSSFLTPSCYSDIIMGIIFLSWNAQTCTKAFYNTKPYLAL